MKYLLELLDDEIYLFKARVEENHHETLSPLKSATAAPKTSDHRASIYDEGSSSDQFPPSQGRLAQAKNLFQTFQSENGLNTTAEKGSEGSLNTKVRGNLKDDVEVFPPLASPSIPPYPVLRDDCISCACNDDNEATDPYFIKMFDAVHITHPSPSKKRSSDTTEDPSPHKAPCNAISHPPFQALQVSTYIPASHSLQRALRDAVAVNITTPKDSFGSERSFVESNASQFSIGSQLTQLTEPDEFPQVDPKIQYATLDTPVDAVPIPTTKSWISTDIFNEHTNNAQNHSNILGSALASVDMINEKSFSEHLIYKRWRSVNLLTSSRCTTPTPTSLSV